MLGARRPMLVAVATAEKCQPTTELSAMCAFAGQLCEINEGKVFQDGVCTDIRWCEGAGGVGEKLFYVAWKDARAVYRRGNGGWEVVLRG